MGNFDKSKLGKDGYLVRVEEHDVKLPCELHPFLLGRVLFLMLLKLAKSFLTAPTSEMGLI